MKQCQSPGCNNPVFSHNYCQRHQHKRTDEKWLLTQYAKKNGFVYHKIGELNTFTKISKAFMRSTIKTKPKEDTGQTEAFEEIWQYREHKSWLSGTPLRQYEDKMDENQCWKKHPLWYNLFHHVLNKKNYRKFIALKDNIILLTPQEHLDIHSLSRDKLERKYGLNKIIVYFDLVETLKERYKND